jgi:hypothetical protein
MTKNTPNNDFEKAWQGKLAAGLDQHLESDQRDQLLAGGDLLDMDSSTEDKIIWSCEMLEKLQEGVDKNAQQEILTSCACHYPKAELDDARGIFLETGDVDQVIDLLQAKFEEFLRDGLELEEDLVLEIINKGWGLAGVRESDRIIATKIPKSGYLEDYFKTEDAAQKRKLYCHCPRVRDGVGDDPQLPQIYCYCGAGFYQGIWETILDEPVQVDVLESVMTGGDVCKIAIHLPETATSKN